MSSPYPQPGMPQPGMPQPGMPQPGMPQPGPHGGPPPKKSKKGCILAGCGGCLFVILALCGFGGYLAYLEEGVSYSDPGDEVQSVPFIPGQPIDFAYEWDGTGYATHRVYVDPGPGAAPGLRVTGDFGCMEYGSLDPRMIDEEYYGSYGAEQPGWIRIFDGYTHTRSSPIACRGTLTLSPPVPSARLVVTRRQRPSDWLSGI